MRMIETTTELADLCRRLQQADAITVDTEFIRDRTYWSRLCLVQVGLNGEGWAVDPLVAGIDLEPLCQVMRDRAVLKVFHAARQDVEIFHHLMGEVPGPIFDTQIAAMVCGFGEQVGYETLVQRLTGKQIDKGSQFTDWARRPLTDRQLGYALADVIHLWEVYTKLEARLRKSGRADWLTEEMAILTAQETYETDPEQAWRRLKARSRSKKYLGVLKAVARWREREAQKRDMPRGHVVKDEAIQELAGERPTGIEELKRLRSVPKGVAEGRLGELILAAVREGLELPAEELPKPPEAAANANQLGPLVDLLKVLLKLKCVQAGVAQKLVANSAELERLAAGEHEGLALLQGWRRELFGADALELMAGRLALAADGANARLIRLEG